MQKGLVHRSRATIEKVSSRGGDAMRSGEGRLRKKTKRSQVPGKQESHPNVRGYSKSTDGGNTKQYASTWLGPIFSDGH